MNEIAKCPNPECGMPCEVERIDGDDLTAKGVLGSRIRCTSADRHHQCNYKGPTAILGPEPWSGLENHRSRCDVEAIRLHNLIARHSPESARRAADELYSYRLIEFEAIEETIEVIERHLPQAPVRGWQLVPEEPTEAMLKAGTNCLHGGTSHGWPFVDAITWQAMLANAPHPEDETGGNE